jgi:PAS domain S-box-containing protein
MKIAHKLILGSLGLVSLSWAVGFYAVNASRQALQTAALQSSAQLATEVMDQVDRSIFNSIEDWSVFLASSLVQETVKASNRQFGNLRDISVYIDQHDQEWRSVPREEITSFMKDILDNELSLTMKRKLDVLEKRRGYRFFGEAFVTNRYGANVAQTGKTSDYRQDDEEWWQRARSEGLFVEDVAFDESAGVYSTDICIRFDDAGGDFLGVAKIVLNIESIASILRARTLEKDFGHTGANQYHLTLLTSEKRIIYSFADDFAGLQDRSMAFSIVQPTERARSQTYSRHDNELGELLGACAFSRGHGEYKGLGWMVTVENQAEAILLPAASLRVNILATSIGVCIFGLILGISLSVWLGRRIARLKDTATELGGGNLSARIEDHQADELGQLARCFNDMASKLKRNSEEMLESEQKLAGIISSVTDHMEMLDEHHTIVWANDVSKRSFGMDIVGRKCYAAFCAREDVCGECLVNQTFSDGEVHEVEIERTGRKGEKRDFWSIASVAARHADGRPELVVQISREITDWKRAEDDLREAMRIREQSEEAAVSMMEDAEKARNAMFEALEREKHTSAQLATVVEQLEAAKNDAEKATHAKSEFLANMSHEIRTPMTAILGFSEMLLEPEQDESERLSAIQTVLRNGEYLLQIINDILDLSKIEAGKIAVEREVCSISDILSEVRSLVQFNVETKGLSFEIENTGGIPETIMTDPIRLRQILINLLGNAIKFTENGSIRLVLRLAACDQGDPVMQFDIVDTGVGMTPQQTAVLFQPFSQADASTSREFGGTGLGLVISRRLAQMLGGDVVLVDSQEGVGSWFRARVSAGPLDDVTMVEDLGEILADSKVKSGVDSSADTDEIDLDGCCVLLAEDGPDNQRLISLVLKKAGADVTVARNGKIAVEKALAALNRRRDSDPKRPFDIVLMDMQMPVMDGYEATRLLRRSGFTGPIIALTAHAMAGDRQRCVATGCDDYLSKPIDRKRLIQVIKNQLVHQDTP